MKSKKTALRLFIVFLILYIFSRDKLFAQTINRDSLRRVAFSLDSIREDSIANALKIRDIGKLDGRKRRLNPAENIRFKADEKNKNADLFRPQKSFVSDTTLLLDSVYVKAFRQAAYERALDDNDKIEKCSWFAFGFGPSTGPSNDSSNVFLNGNLELYGKSLVTADIRINPAIFGTDVENYSILLGKITKQKFSFFTASAGISFVSSHTTYLFSSRNNSNKAGIGIPILLQGYVVAAQAVGLGINVYANINTIGSSAGISFCLAFGRLSTHERN